jgi:hypothetical protein
MVVLNGNFALGCEPETDYSKIHIFQCRLEQTDSITNEVLEPITFVLAYPTVLAAGNLKGGYADGMIILEWRVEVQREGGIAFKWLMTAFSGKDFYTAINRRDHERQNLCKLCEECGRLNPIIVRLHFMEWTRF